MKSALPVILLLLLFAGCTSETDSLKKMLKESDKAKIYFYDEMTGSPYAVSSINSKDTVQMILSGVSAEDTPVLKCGYTGAIEFFKDNQSLMNVEFNCEKGCEHIVFMMNNNSFSKKLTSPALEMLGNLYSQSKIK